MKNHFTLKTNAKLFLASIPLKFLAVVMSIYFGTVYLVPVLRIAIPIDAPILHYAIVSILLTTLQIMTHYSIKDIIHDKLNKTPISAVASLAFVISFIIVLTIDILAIENLPFFVTETKEQKQIVNLDSLYKERDALIEQIDKETNQQIAFLDSTTKDAIEQTQNQVWLQTQIQETHQEQVLEKEKMRETKITRIKNQFQDRITLAQSNNNKINTNTHNQKTKNYWGLSIFAVVLFLLSNVFSVFIALYQTQTEKPQQKITATEPEKQRKSLKLTIITKKPTQVPFEYEAILKDLKRKATEISDKENKHIYEHFVKYETALRYIIAKKKDLVYNKEILKELNEEKGIELGYTSSQFKNKSWAIIKPYFEPYELKTNLKKFET